VNIAAMFIRREMKDTKSWQNQVPYKGVHFKGNGIHQNLVRGISHGGS